MKQNRRNFLKTSGLLAGSAITNNFASIFFTGKRMNKKMELTFKPYTLELKHSFTIASGSRTTTPVMLTEIEYDGIKGYGEASMPPYLGESQNTASAFLSKINLKKFDNPLELEEILTYVDSVDEKNTAAKASVDIALHDLAGKMLNKSWCEIWGFDKKKTPYTSFTIGIDTPEIVKQKVNEAQVYKILKVKLGRENDKEIIETIRSATDKPITVDVNEGWKEKHFALDMISWLNEKNVLFVEQPMPRTYIDDLAWIRENSPLPVIADESVQRISDVTKAYGVYDGINIKLMKCTGMREAHKMLLLARSYGMKIMIGCMTETSCAISAASQLSPEVDWADLDGNLLIKNDPYKGTEVIDGKIKLLNKPGIGLV